MERKRRVRPPLVGQASTGDRSAVMVDLSLEIISNVETEDGSRHSVQEELLQYNYAGKESDCSGAISADICGSQSHGQFDTCGMSSDVNNLKSDSSSQGKVGNTKDNDVMRVSHEIRKDVKCDKIPANRGSVLATRSSVMLLSPSDTQHQTFVSSGQTHGSTIISETAGSARPPSPASVCSVTSSRRLEWDSGADVGYQNYQPNDGEFISNEVFSTIERIALARGFSAAQRLEPEGTTGSMHQLNAVQLKPVTRHSKCVKPKPIAVSTPVDFGQTVGGSVTGTDSECEITPVVKFPADRYIFHGMEHFYDSTERKSTTVRDRVQSAESKAERGCNISSKKVSSSLTDLSQCSLHEPHKNSLRRSQSYLNLLPEEGHKTKSCHYFTSSSFPLQHQHKRSTGLTTCSVSSSSVSTVVPSHESSKMSNQHIQTSALHVPVVNSVGIQVSETEKDSKSLTTLSLPIKRGSSAFTHIAVLNPEQGIELKSLYSDLIDKTKLIVTEDIGTSQHIDNSKPAFFMNQNCTHVSQMLSENISCRKKNHHKLEGNRRITQSSALCKGAHKKGTSEHQWCSSITETQRFDEMSEGIFNTHNSKSPQHSCVNQSEEETTERNSETLDSVTSSTQTTGSWFVGDTPQSTNGNKNVTDRRGSFGVVGSANSFEYLPGHVYESNTLINVKSLHRNAITEYSSTENMSSHPVANFVETKFSASSNKKQESSVSSTLSRDVEKGITLFEDLMNSKSYNSDLRKKFVRQLVNRLVKANDAKCSEFLESHILRVPPKLPLSLPGCVSGVISQKVSHEDVSNGHIVRKAMEREEVSGESASEMQHIGQQQVTTSASTHQAYFVTDKCVETVLSETSGPSSQSENHADSRAETTTSTTQGCAGSSSTGTRMTRNGNAWKELTTWSEKEYEQCKHKQGQCERKSVLLNLCETERENQLSWIRIEIDHLTNLKQLLEKTRNLKNGLDLGMKSHKGIQKKGRNPVTCNKNSEVSTEPESIQSDATCSSNISEKLLRKNEIRHNLPVKPHHNAQSLEMSSSEAPKKHSVTDVFASEIHQNSPEPKVKTAFLNRKDIFTQFPTHVDLYDKRSKYVCPVNKSQLKEKAVQASVSSSVSTNKDKLVGGMMSGGIVAGRINVFTQSKEKKPMIENDAEGSELSDINKNIRIKSECNECGENSAKRSELNDSAPLCCCECKKLLSKITTKIKSKNQSSVDRKSYVSHSKMGDGTEKQKCVSSNTTIQSKNTDDSSARSCMLSSSSTLGNASELTHDSVHVKASVATETVRNIGVQTRQTVSSLPVIPPQWYTLIGEGTNKVSNKVQKNIVTSHNKCPCCGALEDESDTRSESSHITVDGWQCTRCLKMKHNRKCQICGVLKSELPIVQQDGISGHDIAWKCRNCLVSELGQTKSVLNKCVHCGLQKGCDYRKEKHVDCGCTHNTASATVRSTGYILTLETSTDSMSSTAESSGKLLEEVKMKIPARKRYSVSDKVKRRAKQKQGVSELGNKSFRQNQKPVRGVKNLSSSEDGSHRSRHYKREPTLQEYLMANRPDFIQNAEYRRQCLGELANLRELRHKSKQRLLALASHGFRFDGGSAAPVNAGSLCPSPLAKKRIFNQHAMRAQTQRKYRNLSEVQSQKAEKKRKEDYRTNRLMAEVFAKKLQQRVLKGDVNLSNSRSVISIL